MGITYKNVLLLGLAVVVVVAGAWAARQYFDQHPVSDKAFKLCLARDNSACPSGSKFIEGTPGQTILLEDRINKECAHYKRRNSVAKNGSDDSVVADVTCTVQ